MIIRSHRTALALSVAAVLATGCNRESSGTDQRLNDLEQQLSQTQKQLADSKEQAAKEAEAAAQAAAASAPALATAEATGTKPAAPKPPSEKAQSQKPESQKHVTADQAASGRAEAQRALEQQQGINAAQAETNAQLQQQVEQLKPREITVPAGTRIPVRTTSDLSTEKLSTGSAFDALLEEDLRAGETVLARAASRVHGMVVTSDPGGKVKGVASLTVDVRSIVGVRGNTIAVKTDAQSVDAASSKKKDAVRTGVATGVGAVVGGLVGGGKGAAIGAGAGAAAGVGTNMATRGAAAVIPAETLLEFHLTSPVTVLVQRP